MKIEFLNILPMKKKKEKITRQIVWLILFCYLKLMMSSCFTSKKETHDDHLSNDYLKIFKN